MAVTDTDVKIVYIATHYGFENQSRQCVEEMAELTQAICKYKRAQGAEKRAAMENLQEELADVEIMVRQLKALCDKEKVEETIKYKLKRQLERIRNEKETESTC